MATFEELQVALDLLEPGDKRAELYQKFIELVKEHTGASHPEIVETAAGAAIDSLIRVFLGLREGHTTTIAAENFMAAILESTR